MKHFPARRFQLPLSGISHSHSRVPRRFSLDTVVLLCCTAFAAGFMAALYIAATVYFRAL